MANHNIASPLPVTGRLLPACLCAMLLLGTPLAAADNFRVWAVSDNVRVNPLDNRVIEANVSVLPGTYAGDYSKQNIVWNADSKQVTLKSARNETVAFQIIVERLGTAALTNVKLALGNLKGPSGRRIPADHVDLYKEWYVNVKTPSFQKFTLGTGWYPDALLPCLRWTGNLYPNMYVHPFEIPDILNNIGPGQKSQALWVDIYVPKEQPAGAYESVIHVSSDNGADNLKLRLDVWNFALPEESHLKPNIHTNTELHTFTEDLELKYYQMIRRHRLALGALGYAPKMKITGSDVQFDWKEYDNRLAKYLDGTAFTEKYGYNGPGYGVPTELLILPFDAYPVFSKSLGGRGGQPLGKEFKFYRPWPVEIPKEGINEAYRKIWKSAFLKFHEHLKAHPEWGKTRPVVFFLSLDESYNKKYHDQMALYAKLLKESGAESLKFRIDGWYPLDVLKGLAEYVDIAITGPAAFEPGIEEARKKGLEDWFYIGATSTDKDLVGKRALSWVCWKYGIHSWTIWELDFNSLRAYLDPATYRPYGRDRVQNGTGMLVYRGETMGLSEPVASIRLKALRRGSQDYEYFWLLSQKKGGKALAQEVVDSIIHDLRGKDLEYAWGNPALWTPDPEAWEKARILAGESIAAPSRRRLAS